MKFEEALKHVRRNKTIVLKGENDSFIELSQGKESCLTNESSMELSLFYILYGDWELKETK